MKSSCIVEFQAGKRGLTVIIDDNGKGIARYSKRGVGLS
jgi:hypothetical protein